MTTHDNQLRNENDCLKRKLGSVEIHKKILVAALQDAKQALKSALEHNKIGWSQEYALENATKALTLVQEESQ